MSDNGQRDPGGKFTIFSLLSLAGAVFGAATGAVLGNKIGWPLAIVGGILGLVLGFLPGQFLGNYGVMSLARSLNKEDSPALWKRLKEQYYISHLIVLILLGRGESRKELATHTLNMLLSDNPDIRWHGWRTLNINFPEVAAKLEGINPMQADAVRDMRIPQVIDDLDAILEQTALPGPDSHQ